MHARKGRAPGVPHRPPLAPAPPRRSRRRGESNPRSRRSSGSGVNSRLVDTFAYQRSSGSPSRIAARPLLRFVQLSSARGITRRPREGCFRRGAEVWICAPAGRPEQARVGRPRCRSPSHECKGQAARLRWRCASRRFSKAASMRVGCAERTVRAVWAQLGGPGCDAGLAAVASCGLTVLSVAGSWWRERMSSLR